VITGGQFSVVITKFVTAEQEARKSAALGVDTDLPKIVRAMNQLTARLDILEQTSRNENAQAADEQKKLKSEAETWRKSHEQAVEMLRKDLKEKSNAGLFAEAMANIRGHLLKARMEMSLKNLAIAKTELDLIDGLFTKAAALTPQEGKSPLLKMQETVRTIKGEIDTNFPAAMDRLDLLWYEIGEFTAKPQANQ